MLATASLPVERPHRRLRSAVAWAAAKAAAALSRRDWTAALCVLLLTLPLLLLASQLTPASTMNGLLLSDSSGNRQQSSRNDSAHWSSLRPQASAGSSSSGDGVASACSSSSPFSLVARWLVVSSSFSPRLLSVHWSDVNADWCPDIVAVTSASPSSRDVSVTHIVNTCRNDSSAAFLPPSSPLLLLDALHADGSLSALAVDADGDYESELLIAVKAAGMAGSAAAVCADSVCLPQPAASCPSPRSLRSLRLPACTVAGCSPPAGGGSRPLLAVDVEQDGLLELMLGESVSGYGAAFHSVAVFPAAAAAEEADCLSPLVTRNALPGLNGCLVTAVARLTGAAQPSLLCFQSVFPQQLHVFQTRSRQAVSAVSRDLRPKPAAPAAADRSHSLRDACMADINGDGIDDFVLATADSALTLWLRQSNKRYTVLAVATGWAKEPTQAAAVVCADLNNDGWPDVVVLYDAAGEEWERSAVFLNLGPAGGQNGDSPLELVGSLPQLPASASSLSVADYDSDGFLDVLVAGSDGIALYRNCLRAAQSQSQHWLQLSLWGMNGASNSQGVGGTVQLTLPGRQQAVSLVAHEPSSALFPFSQHHRRLHVGLAEHAVVPELVVSWPRSHAVETVRYDSVAADQHLHLLQLNTAKLGRLLAPALQRRLAGYSFVSGPCIKQGETRLQPSIFVLGVWKAGTTSLSAALTAHPRVVSPANKELHYFSTLAEDLPLDFYLQHFPCGLEKQQRTYDATASALFSSQAPRLLLTAFPRAKLIVVLRDPAERAYSHHRMNLAQMRQQTSIASTSDGQQLQLFHQLVQDEIRSFQLCIHSRLGLTEQQPLLTSQQMVDEKRVEFAHLSACTESETDSVLRPGLYSVLLRRWLDALDSLAAGSRQEQLLLLSLEQLESKPASVMAGVLSLLDLPQSERAAMKKKNSRGGSSSILNSTAALLRNFYSPFTQQLNSVGVRFLNEYRPPWLKN